MKKRIDEYYKWRYPTIIDNDPELISYLKTKPLYDEAIYVRKGILTRKKRFIEMAKNRSPIPRKQWDLFADEPAPRHLTLLKSE